MSQTSNNTLSSRQDDQSSDEFNIDFIKIFSKIWNRRKTIATGVILFIFAGIFYNEYTAKYHSDGFYKISGITPINYKRYQSVVLDNERFRTYAQEVGVSQQSFSELSGIFSIKSNAFFKIAPLIYSLTPKDAKEFIYSGNSGGKDRSTDQEQFLGMQVNVPASNGDQAKESSLVITEYFVDTVMYVEMTDWLKSNAGQREEKILSIDKKIIKANQEIAEHIKRISATKSIIKNNPASLKIEPPLLSTDGKERFMPPLIQIVGSETQISEAKLLIFKLENEKIKLKIISDFYKSASELLNTTVSGKILFKKIDGLEQSFEKTLKTNSEIKEEALNEIKTEIEKRRNLYFQEFRYISGPTLPEYKTKRSTLNVVLVAGFMGAIFAILLILFKLWWKINSIRITNPLNS